MGTVQARKVSRPAQPDVERDTEDFDGDLDSNYSISRMPSSARRYKTAPPMQHDTLDEPITGGVLIQRRRASLGQHTGMHGVASNAVAPTHLEPQLRHSRSGPLTHTHEREFPWVSVLIGMVVMILLVMALSAIASWWQGYQDDIHFGRPRTYQFDAVVGHEDSSSNPTHFICLNLHGHVEIIEIPGGDASHTRVFNGPTLLGPGQDLTPVTGEIRDIDGKPDLVVHIQGQQIIFINDGQTFHQQ
ncbi:MAG TPA: hypothetical protein VFB12_05810 [Ktedonobacteraceae bacterium]|nr:hypothetical protein [Ktedonobacteraceae bacterium]